MRYWGGGRGRWLRTAYALLLAGACAAVFIVGSPAPVNAADVAVTINSFAFTPGTITVPFGTRIVWTNQQGVTHTTTSDTGVWDSGFLTTGQSFDFTFTQPGTFAYHCSIHPGMHGTIIVLPPPPIPQPVGHETAPAATSAPAVTVAPASLPTLHVVSTAVVPPGPILGQPARH